MDVRLYAIIGLDAILGNLMIGNSGIGGLADCDVESGLPVAPVF
jgi:hypothetical protein